MITFLKRLLLKKSISDIHHEESHHGHGLKRVLNVYDITFLGVAAVIGAGVFSTIGQAAFKGGPGISVLFLFTAITCGFSALCYAEYASRFSIAGSAYTYSYISFGEIVAWIIGWALILEYLIGNVVVAISWSSYFNNLLLGLDINLPKYLVTNYSKAHHAYISVSESGKALSAFDPSILEGYYAYLHAPVLLGYKIILNIPAGLIVLLVTYITFRGIKESKQSTNIMVIFKLIVIVFIIGLGFFYVKPDNWTPFMPNGIEGVLAGVSAVFYAYIGFDAVSTTSEECKNPKRDLPKGMIYALVICTILYVLVALVLTGITNYTNLDVSDPLAHVFELIHFSNVSYIVSISAIIATTSVLLVFQLGQPRIWMTMSRDGLLPKQFSKIHKKYQTPYFSNFLCGAATAIFALFADSSIMTELTSIGTLFAFVLVCLGVLYLPKRPTNEIKGFRIPVFNGKFIIVAITMVYIYFNLEHIESIFRKGNDLLFDEVLQLLFVLCALIASFFSFKLNLNAIPIIGTLSCLYLMTEIPPISWLIFLIWISIGLTIYFGYSKKHSHLNNSLKLSKKNEG